MAGTLLSSDDPRIASLVERYWRDYFGVYAAPRSRWLGDVEDVLRELHPTANSDSITLTARSLAPFPLMRQGVA